MIIELKILALAALLQMLQFVAYALPANIQLGTRVTMGNRDHVPELAPKTGRLQRALNNHFEGLILFTIAVLVVTLGDKSTGFSAICAWAYLIARILYVPAYYFGLVPWRSLIWAVGFCATALMLLSALF